MGRGPWIIAGGIVVAALIVAGTLWVLDLRQEPVAVTSPGASPTAESPSPSPTATAEPTESPSPEPSPEPSPTPTEPPLRQARAAATTFYSAWVANDRPTALTVGTQEAVQMAFLVPVRSRDSTRFERCSLNGDLGEGSYQCTVADRRSDIIVLSMVARPVDGVMKVAEVIFHAD